MTHHLHGKAATYFVVVLTRKIKSRRFYNWVQRRFLTGTSGSTGLLIKFVENVL